jgi:hypothetical protein
MNYLKANDFYFANRSKLILSKVFNLILTVSNPYKYHSFIHFHLASSLALKGGDSTERGVGLGGGAGVGNGSKFD